jgi:hypothetical protein
LEFQDAPPPRPGRRPDDAAPTGDAPHPQRRAYQPKLFEKDLTAREAERRIAVLKAEIELANSF